MSNYGAYAIRDLHVASTDSQCIRHVLGKLRPEARQRCYRNIRHDILRDALAAHYKHQALVKEFAL